MSRAKPHILWTLYRVWRAWRHCPELRLGQLLSCVALKQNDYPIFYIHDEDLVANLDTFIHENTRHQ